MKQRMAFTLDESVSDELNARIPKQLRSQFVEKAIADALRIEAKKTALDSIDALAQYASGQKDSVTVLRELREGRQRYLINRE